MLVLQKRGEREENGGRDRGLNRTKAGFDRCQAMEHSPWPLVFRAGGTRQASLVAMQCQDAKYEVYMHKRRICKKCKGLYISKNIRSYY